VDAANPAGGTWARLAIPYISGHKVGDVVDGVGCGACVVVLGDPVMAVTCPRDDAGGYRELPVVDVDQVARLYSTPLFVDLAATPLAGGGALAVLAGFSFAPTSLWYVR
jgi:hypothetical protein